MVQSVPPLGIYLVFAKEHLKQCLRKSLKPTTVHGRSECIKSIVQLLSILAATDEEASDLRALQEQDIINKAEE